MRRIVLLAFLLLSTFPAVTPAEDAKGVEHWLERMARFYERTPFAMDYYILVQAYQGDDTAVLSAEGSSTYSDATHMRMAMRMTTLASGQPSETVVLLVVVDGENAWIEIEDPTGSVQVLKLSADQFQRVLAEASPGTLDPGNPLAEVRRVQELVDFEVAEEGAERVVLRAPVSDRLRQEMGPRGELLGPDAGIVLELDAETGAPLRMEIESEAFRMHTTFENLRFLDAGAFTDGTLAYQPPEGVTVVEPPGTPPEEPETIRLSGYVDTTGKVVIEPVYQTRSDFSEGLAIVRIPGIEREGAIDQTGKMVIEPKFESLGSFSEGLATARLGGGDSGYVDNSGQWVIEPRFDGVETFSEGLALVMVVQTEVEHAWIDPTGEIVIGPRPYRLARSFSEGVAAFQNDDELWGLIDTTGAVLVEPRFHRIREAAEGLIAVKQGDSWGFADLAGSLAIEPRWGAVFDFREGLAAVGRRGQGWSYVDTRGTVVIEGPFEEAFPFREGLAAVKLSGAWGFIDPGGRFAIEPRFTQAAWFTDGLALVEMDGKWGYVDPTGKMVIEPRFEDADSFSEGLARFGVSAPLSPLHSEIIEEARWADDVLSRLARDDQDRDYYEGQVSGLERQLELVVPLEPGIEEFVTRLRDVAETYLVGIEVEHLGQVDHGIAGEERLKLELAAPEAFMEMFVDRARYVRPLTKLHEPHRVGSDNFTMEVSIYWGKPPEIPPLRTCRRYSHTLDAAAPFVERRAADTLDALCDELDAQEELRRLKVRAEALASHINAIFDLSRETRGDPPDMSEDELDALIEKLPSDGEE